MRNYGGSPSLPLLCSPLNQGVAEMDMVRISGIKPSPGLAGKGPDKTVTVAVVVRSDELGRFNIDVHVPDRGSKEANAEDARAALVRFARKLSEALKMPMIFEKQ
jgi:hypothetical protein